MDPQLLKDIAQVIGMLAATIGVSMKYLTARLSSDKRDREQNRDRILTLEQEIKYLREKVESERIDFKERLKEITDYLYNRPR
jgi:hypothetical protein